MEGILSCSALGLVGCEAAQAERVSPTSTHLGFGVQGDDFLVVVQQFAGVSDVNGCFLFVTSKNPNLQACLTQFSNGFRDSVLQAVFNPSGTWSKVQQCG